MIFSSWNKQAWIILILYLILNIILAIIMIRDGNYGAAFLSFIFFSITGIIIAYDVNCTIVGECNIWSWVKTVLLSISPIMAIIGLVILLKNQKPAHQEQVVKPTNLTN